MPEILTISRNQCVLSILTMSGTLQFIPFPVIYHLMRSVSSLKTSTLWITIETAVLALRISIVKSAVPVSAPHIFAGQSFSKCATFGWKIEVIYVSRNT